MHRQQHAKIEAILPQSPLADTIVEPGWVLLGINGQPVVDIIDYYLEIGTTTLELLFLDTFETLHSICIEKENGRSLGIVFESPTLDRVKTCANHCAFCFVDQMPLGLRSSLYVKDDDYRLSFLSGSYITLSNLRPEDINRIVAHKLSPLYVSVHAYDAAIRRELLGYPSDDFWERFDRLLAGGIALHCQIVACPEKNDGAVLDETLRQLAIRLPGVLSVTVVPVGLTEHRQHLTPLRPFRRDEARRVIAQVECFSAAAKAGGHGQWVWAADEFYLLADQLERLPAADAYEGYQHFENGVGMMRSLWEDWQEYLPLPQAKEKRPVVILTGVSGAKALQPLFDDLQTRLEQVEIRVLENRLFGSRVTVTGLICGRDILEQQEPDQSADRLLLLPEVMLLSDAGQLQDDKMFLDNVTFGELQRRYAQHDAELRVIPASAAGLYQALFGPRPKRRSVRRSFS